MKKSKMPAVISAVLSVTLLLCACGSKDKYGTLRTKSYEQISEKTYADSAVIAENDNFKLNWDADDCNIIMTDKRNGKLWSTSPIGPSGETLEDANSLFSPLDIEVVMRSAFKSIKQTGKNGAVNNGGVSSKLIENGIELTFFFDEYQIAIPVEYTLSEKGLKASVNLENIGENAESSDYRIFKIALAPYLCAARNDNNNYLFVPSGSGALMYTDVRGDGVARNFSGKIYGADATAEKKFEDSEIKEIRMPVFGATDRENTLCAIVTDGAQTCYIDAEAGDAQTGISNAYASFQVRGYNASVMEFGGATGNKEVEYFSYDRIEKGRLSVVYQPIVSDIGYMGIAEAYRDYLKDNYGLTADSEDKTLSLEFVGAVETKKHFIGIPYYSADVLTSFSDVSSIISKIGLDNNIDVKLKGFGESGISYGKLAGGFKLTGVTGGKKEFSELTKFCSKSNINLYYDCELLYFRKSSGGFSPSRSNSSTANGYPAAKYRFSPATDDILKDTPSASILSRALLEKAIKKTATFAEKVGMPGISIDTISNTSWSDFSDREYINSGNIQSDISKAVNTLKKSNLSVSVSDANDYSAVISDKIFDAPLSSAEYNSLDVDIPFYQIVFKGYVPLSSESINTSANSRKSYLQSVSVGSALQFSLINNYSSKIASYLYKDIQAMKAENNIEMIKSMVNQAEKYFNSVNKAHITGYEIFGNIRKTEFDNGVVIYVNFGDNSAAINGITVPANGFEVVENAD